MLDQTITLPRADYDALVEALRKARKFIAEEAPRSPWYLLDDVDAALAKVAAS